MTGTAGARVRREDIAARYAGSLVRALVAQVLGERGRAFERGRWQRRSAAGGQRRGQAERDVDDHCLAQLVAEGRLAWDDPAGKYLPGFQLYDAYVTREITLRDLLGEPVEHGVIDMEIDQVTDAPAYRGSQFRLRNLGCLDHHQLVVADTQDRAARRLSQPQFLHDLLQVVLDSLIR